MPKKPRKKTQPCIECRGTMTFKTKADQLEYKGYTTTVRTKGWWCDTCGEGVVAGEALNASEKALMELKAEVDGILTPDEVAAIRRRLRISQRRAGEILGGGPRAFQKYESGAVAVSAAMSNLLRLLDKDPRRLEELERLAETG